MTDTDAGGFGIDGYLAIGYVVVAFGGAVFYVEVELGGGESAEGEVASGAVTLTADTCLKGETTFLIAFEFKALLVVEHLVAICTPAERTEEVISIYLGTAFTDATDIATGF